MFSSFLTLRLPVLVSIFIWIQIAIGFAQSADVLIPKIKFGEIKPAEFLSSSTDTTSEAVVLYESGDISFEVDQIILKYYVRMLIRRKSAYTRATVATSVRRGYGMVNEKMSDLEGRTYNLVNGHVVADPLDLKTAHFTEKAAEEYWIEKFTMPNVREGSVIEYRYTLRTPFYITRSPEPWRFQRDIPVDWSQLHIVLPHGFPHRLILGGSLKLTVEDIKATKISLIPGQIKSDAQESLYAIKHVPSFQHENYVANEDDYISKIDFERPNYLDVDLKRESIMPLVGKLLISDYRPMTVLERRLSQLTGYGNRQKSYSTGRAIRLVV
ncbi:hypothetical protein [Spirosoma sp. KNUC1025]|uniref:hypothetical protein n=1 Tax=Spirosoma sp. KNUC1025 TaxID=2894082 RepID=UPI00386DAFE1|nr:hypothetical protein LN737_25400 [Spirosoma sp. KNUC1025]